MSVLPDFIMPDVAKAANPAKACPHFSNFSNFSRGTDQEIEKSDSRSLAAKLRAYGLPYPLTVEGRIACWLVPDDEAAKRNDADEPTYTAADIEKLVRLDADSVCDIHHAMGVPGAKLSAAWLAEGNGGSDELTRNTLDTSGT